MFKKAIFLTFLLRISLLHAQEEELETPFKDYTAAAGIKHQYQVFEGFLGGGICVFDFNNDGFDDLFMTGGLNDDVLYVNNKNGTFTNVYEKSGLGISKKYLTQGAVSADVNRDGWPDLYVTTITSKGSPTVIPRAPNLLFINNKNNTFRDATKEFGLDELNSFSTGANFGDFNADGFPDLYVGNYFTQYPGNLSSINENMVVGANQIAEGFLLKNEGGRKFRNVYKDYGLNHRGFGFGGVFSDYDNDGDQDLIVNHDFGYKRTPNLLLKNNGGGFQDVGKETEMDLKINSMASTVGDYNNDGLMDYFFTNIRFNKFMVNQGIGKPFAEKSLELGLNTVMISWGANFADFDHDGDLDLFVANGDLNPNCMPMGDFYFENQNGRFAELGRSKGVNDYGIGRGSVVFDLENDGDLDILVVNQKPVLDGYPVASFTTLFRNESAAKGNWIKIKLNGLEAESQGLGSKVEIVVNGKRQIREIDGGGSSHLSQNATFAHFGVGNATKIDEIIIHWTGGQKQVLKDQAINQLLVIKQTELSLLSKYWIIISVLAVVGLGLFWRMRRK